MFLAGTRKPAFPETETADDPEGRPLMMRASSLRRLGIFEGVKVSVECAPVFDTLWVGRPLFGIMFLSSWLEARQRRRSR